MNKKILALLLSGMMIVPMTGCNAHLTIGGKEIFSFSDKEDVQQETIQKQNEGEKRTDEKTKKEVKEEKQDKKTVEEKDKKVKEKYCDWCEAKTDHNTDEHIGQCYDCGEYKPAKDMEFDGRSFHCGCIDEEPTEELWVCPGCDGSYPESEMIEDTENGIWYCYGCYDEIMNYRMGGDANGDLEDWEF